MENNKNQSQNLTADLYFLIQRFLSSGPLKKTLQVLNEELEDNKILPKRLDWEGNQHERTVEDMERQFPLIRPDYLMQLCYEAVKTDKALTTNTSLSSFLSFKPKVSDENKVLRNFNQFCNYVTRYHGVPVHDIRKTFNLVNTFRGREISGPFSRQRAVMPMLYSSMQCQRITLGHLSAVYCILFDYSGKYIITGADDLLIKVWSAATGRLIASFRGASSEITDIAVNLENTLLAAGSIDRILRIWNLQTGSPVAVLTGHTGMITSVNFCPTDCCGLRYVITTSTDGSVAFWAYTFDSGGKAEFRLTPILYQEKLRPGQAQMICSSFSPGGTFLATGSADHHVRIYYMKGDDGPARILETEAHTDRVDSIQWAHSRLRLVSGSKDGTAIIWWFESQQWKPIYLHMNATMLNSSKKINEDTKRLLKVTMVAWDLSDSRVVTAVSDHTLKVWTSSNGQLEKVLTGHTDEVYVLEAHPHDTHIILSAGHDGQLFVWDIAKGEIISRYLNTIEGQGYGAIFDVKWSPDGNMIGATDSHGHLLKFGFGNGGPFFEQLPKELFFHTDYRPLVRDSNHFVLDEQTQIPPHLMPPPFLVDIDGNPYPPMLQRLVPGREHCNVEQLVPNIVIGNEGTQEVIQDIPENHSRNVQDLNYRSNVFRANRRNRDIERIRHSTGDWQTDPNMEWKRNVLIQPLRGPYLKKAQEISEIIKDAEMEEYLKQLRQRPHMICTSTLNNVRSRKEEKKNKVNKYQTRRTRQTIVFMSNSESSESSGNEDQFSESSGYSDWMVEEGVNLEPPKRSKRRQVIHNSISDAEDEDVEEEEEEAPPREKRNNQAEKVEVPKATAAPSTSTGTTQRGSKLKVSEQYRLSEWLSETRPRKSPYYPQMGDEIVYFQQGHQLYLDAVTLKNVYEISAKDLPWNKMAIKDLEYVKVIGIQYEIKPPRLCCLRLAMLDEEGRLTGKIFTVKFHDMPDVLDFFVLKQTYTTSVSRNWAPEDKFRCMIDDEWWVGEIVENSPTSELFPSSPFMCYEIKWHNGERERMSPWDLEPIDIERMPEDESQALPVLEHELNAILYKPVSEDWPNNDRDTVCKYIVAGMTKVMELAIAEPFLVPVDISIYPSYAFIIEYPIDLSTIKSRFETNFYRRLTAAQFDIRYLATNAEKFNERHSIIVKYARILTELCLRIVKNCSCYVDVPTIYHQLMDAYDSSDTEEEVGIVPSSSSSRSLRVLPVRCLKSASDWKAEALLLVDAMWDCEDSVPFRTPVNPNKYPDYQVTVTRPMDLGTVKENLLNDTYDVPQDFCEDVRLIFQNSRTYNTNKRSRIYVMTVRLAAIFEEHIQKIIYNWKNAERRELQKRKQSSETSFSSTSGSSSNSELDVEEDNKPLVELKPRRELPALTTITEQDSDSDIDDDMPLEVLKSINKASTESDSCSRQSLEKSEKPKPVSGRKSSSSSDSGDSYKPVAEYSRNNRKRLKAPTSSEEDEDEAGESSDSDKSERIQVRKSTRTRRPVRNKVDYYLASDSDENISRCTRKKRRCIVEDSSRSNSEEEEEEGEGKVNGNLENHIGERGGNFTTVSSRGRVRKLTPRAQALMKKDKKFI